MREVSQAERGFDFADASHAVLEASFAQDAFLLRLEAIAQLVNPFRSEDFTQGGENDGVLTGRVVGVHAAEVLKLVKALKSRETKRIEEIHAGQVFKAEINNTLKSKGVIS